MEKKRYYNIDFLRIFFVILIVYFHFIRYTISGIAQCPLIDKLSENAMWIGQMGNAALFIISGYFLYETFIRYKEPFIKFAIRKLIRLWPTLCFALISMYLCSLFNLCQFDIGQNLLNMFLITKGAGGLTVKYSSLIVSWFICALFWCSLFYFALFKIIKDEFKFNFVLMIIIYYTLVLFLNSTSIPHQDVIFMFFSRSGASAVGMIGLGIILRQVFKQINLNRIKLNPLILTACEIALFFYLVNGCFFKVFKDTLSVIFFADLILISLFILNKGYISRFLNHHIILKFGKYAFSIYIMQQVSHALTKNYILKHIEMLTMHPILTIWGSLFFSILLGVITYHLIENPSANYLKKNLLDKYDYYFAQRERERE